MGRGGVGVILTAMSLTLGACSTGPVSTATENSPQSDSVTRPAQEVAPTTIAGTWKLVGGSESVSGVREPAESVRLSIDEDGSFTTELSCGEVTGRITFSPDQIVADEITFSNDSCPTPMREEAEWIFQVFTTLYGASLTQDGSLDLLGSSGTLAFSR